MKKLLTLAALALSFNASAKFLTVDEIKSTNDSLKQMVGVQVDEVTMVQSMYLFLSGSTMIQTTGYRVDYDSTIVYESDVKAIADRVSKRFCVSGLKMKANYSNIKKSEVSILYIFTDGESFRFDYECK